MLSRLTLLISTWKVTCLAQCRYLFIEVLREFHGFYLLLLTIGKAEVRSSWSSLKNEQTQNPILWRTLEYLPSFFIEKCTRDIVVKMHPKWWESGICKLLDTAIVVNRCENPIGKVLFSCLGEPVLRPFEARSMCLCFHMLIQTMTLQSFSNLLEELLSSGFSPRIP